jgi:hypothetical protein
MDIIVSNPSVIAADNSGYAPDPSIDDVVI